MKTNATRQLDKLGIAYELREYEVDSDCLSNLTPQMKKLEIRVPWAPRRVIRIF
jgi:hypothetical protein